MQTSNFPKVARGPNKYEKRCLEDDTCVFQLVGWDSK
jgi:hypothetical protein